MALYVKGEVVSITATFTDKLGIAGPVGALIDPGSVSLSFTPPEGGIPVTTSMARLSLGMYRAFIDTSLYEEGTIPYKIVSTNNLLGIGQGIKDSHFIVRDPNN